MKYYLEHLGASSSPTANPVSSLIKITEDLPAPQDHPSGSSDQPADPANLPAITETADLATINTHLSDALAVSELSDSDLVPNWIDRHMGVSRFLSLGTLLGGMAGAITTISLLPQEPGLGSFISLICSLVVTTFGVGLSVGYRDLGTRSYYMLQAKYHLDNPQLLIENNIATEEEIIRVTEAYRSYRNTVNCFPTKFQEEIVQEAVESLDHVNAPVKAQIDAWNTYLHKQVRLTVSAKERERLARWDKYFEEQAAQILAKQQVKNALVSEASVKKEANG